MKKHTSRFMAALLVIGMLLGVLAGCSESTEPESNRNPSHQPETTQPVELKELNENQKLQDSPYKAFGDGSVKEHTVMIYMVGSNLESEDEAASIDLEEIKASGLDVDKVNLVVYTGGSKSWKLAIPSEYNCIWMLNQNKMLDLVAATGQPMNMGDPSTFLDFLDYTYKNFPAEKYSLICWDHGGGPLYGFGNDELFGYDPLHLPEMQAALKESAFAEEKFEMLGFDACLMANLEVAEGLSDYARYLVASEELEPGTGWDYSFLSALNNGSTEEMAEAILDTYEISMKASRWKPNYTLSWVDLSKLDGIWQAMDGLYEPVTQAVVAGGYSQVAKARNETRRFGLTRDTKLAESSDLVDLLDAANQLGSEYSGQVQALRSSLSSAVLGQVSNIPEANGLTVYSPYDNKQLYQQAGQVHSTMCESEGYVTYLDAFSDLWLNGKLEAHWQEQQVQVQQQPEGDYLTFRIDSSLLADVATVQYNVLSYNADSDTYRALLTDCTAKVGNDGQVLIPADPELFMLYPDARADGTLWTVSQLDPSGDTYVTVGSGLVSSEDIIIGGSEPIRVTMTAPEGSRQVTIQSVSPRPSEEAEALGKQDVDISKWGVVLCYSYPVYRTESVDGKLLPWDQWETEGGYDLYFATYEYDFSFVRVPVSEAEGQFWCQIVLKDTYGNVIGCQLEQLNKGDENAVATVATPEGTMTFRLGEDFAILEKYEGSDKTVEVPEYVEDKMVVTIGSNAFSRNWDLESVVLPDSVSVIEYSAFASCYHLTSVNMPKYINSIGNSAFAGTALQELELPFTLSKIGNKAFFGTDIQSVTLPEYLAILGEGAFGNCTRLTRIDVRPENTMYKSVDGVVFKNDGSVLLAYPAGRTGRYDVPAGVQTIGPAAFRGAAGLTEITFPAGLKKIDRLAFCDANGLQAIELPDGLQIIGNAAFGCSVGTDMSEAVETVSISRNVQWIGVDAFACYKMQAFEVASGNPNYTSENGCLLNASGTKLIQVPYGAQGTVEVPNGVCYVDWHAFDQCDEVTHIVYPDTVVAVNHAAGVPKALEKITVGKGMTDWANLSACVRGVEVELSPDNPYYICENGAIYTYDKTELLVWYGDEEELRIPEGVTKIAEDAFPGQSYGNATLKKICLPASLQSMPEGVLSNVTGLQAIELAGGNKCFAVYDNLLYSADGKQLLAVPVGTEEAVIVRDGTQEICAYAFGPSIYQWKMPEIRIPEGVKIIREGNFAYGTAGTEEPLRIYLPASLTTINPSILAVSNVQIHCPAGSAAEEFAERVGLEVVNS